MHAQGNYWLLVALIIITCNCVEIWDIWETSVTGPSSGNPFKEIDVYITLTSPSKNKTTLHGFYNGNGIYMFRFMPNLVGTWRYFTNSNHPDVEDKTGSFKVTNATGNNKGPVYAVNNINISNGERPYFRYTNGDIYFECGTTTYAWIELPSEYTQQTINTLKYLVSNNIFNKVRMFIFPYYQTPYTHLQQPVAYPFTGNKSNNWNNFSSFNLTYWSMLDNYLQTLQDINIIIDLIIFHPYDNGQWGFDCMGGNDPIHYNVTNDLFYLKYLIARVASYRNLWWSMANEYDKSNCKNTDIPNNYSIWDTYFKYLIKYDPYTNPEKEKSIHQGQIMYNYSQPWTTHFSIQGHQNIDYKYYYKKFNVQKALILDEVQYEGNISRGWGNLTAKQEVYRFWEGVSVGMEMGHSECFLPNATNNQSGTSIMWYNYGTVLKGESYKKIKWFYEFWTNYTIHPLFYKLITFCYVESVYNSWNSNYKNITGCYVSQLYDSINYSYYFIRWTDPTNTHSTYVVNYNKTINIKLNNGVYSMYKLDEWNQQIILLNDNVTVKGNNGYTYTPQILPQTIQFINKNSEFKV